VAGSAVCATPYTAGASVVWGPFSSLYPACDPLLPARVGSMTVAPAWSDSGIKFSLHWLVVSFFTLTFLFSATATVIDVVRVHLRRRRRHVMGEDDDTIDRSAAADAAADGRSAQLSIPFG